MAYREGDATVVFEGVKVIDRRSAEAQARSVLCEFPDGSERFVSRNQVPSWFEFPDNDEPFELEVTEWLASKWAEEPPPAHVVVEGVVVLRQSEKAIQVRLPTDGKPEWVPLRGIDKGSPVQGEGDSGELWIKPWLAEAKGWSGKRTDIGGGKPQGPRGFGGANIGQDARRGYQGDDLENPEPDPRNGGDGDDKIPFDEAPGGRSGGEKDKGLFQVSSAKADRRVLSPSKHGRRLSREVQGVYEVRRPSWLLGKRRSQAGIRSCSVPEKEAVGGPSHKEAPGASSG